jgi:hypothetical protein
MAITFEGVRRIALALDGVAESTSYGTPAFKLGGKLIARLREDSETLVIGTTFEEREELMAAEPQTYFITDHYLKYPWVLVRLSHANVDALRDLLGRACRLVSTVKIDPVADAPMPRPSVDRNNQTMADAWPVRFSKKRPWSVPNSVSSSFRIAASSG